MADKQKSTVDLYKNTNIFWMLNALFWFTHWFAWILIETRYITDYPANFIHLLQYTAPFLLTFGLRLLYKKYNLIQLKLTKLILKVIIHSLILGIMWVLFLFLLVFIFYGNITVVNISHEIANQLWLKSYTFAAWSTIYLGFKFYEALLLQKQNTEKAELLAESAQLEMLRYQLNPHFLFNTLNSARTLVQIDPPLAQEMLTQISEFLRYSLTDSKKNSIPLIKELEAINNYLDIEKVRFKEKLKIEYQIDPETHSSEIPVFLILPLIENAIKHGIKTSKLPLEILLKTSIIDGDMQINVINTGRWIERTESENNGSTGIGLKNVRRRLENMYGDNFLFEIFKDDNSTHVSIKIKKN